MGPETKGTNDPPSLYRRVLVLTQQETALYAVAEKEPSLCWNKRDEPSRSGYSKCTRIRFACCIKPMSSDYGHHVHTLPKSSCG